MDVHSLKEMAFKDIDKEVLLDIENIVANKWDVVKKSRICLKKFGSEVIAENVDVDIKEKTMELGHGDEMEILTFTFLIENSVVKAHQVSLYDKYDPDDLNHLKVSSRNSKHEIDFNSVDENVTESKKDDWYDGIYYYVLYYKTEKNKGRFEEKMMKVQGPIFSALTSGTWEPFEEKTEPNFTVTVENLVAFGDFCDARKKAVSTETPSQGSTIVFNINTVRSFSPGEYKLSLIRGKEDWTPFVVFHHKLVSPRKVVTHILLTTDFNQFTPDVSNSLNRYDWCHAMHWGFEDLTISEGFIEDFDYEKWEVIDDNVKTNPLFRQSKIETVYFTPVLDSESFEIGVKKGFQKESVIIPGSHQVYGNTLASLKKEAGEMDDVDKTVDSKYADESKNVSIGMDMRIVEPNFEWLYGAVLEDEETRQNFALVVLPDSLHYMDHFEMGAPEAFKKQVFEMEETKFKLKMEDFF